MKKPIPKLLMGLLLFILGFITPLMILGFASGSSKTTAERVETYKTAQKISQKNPTVAAGSEAETAALKAWKDLLSDLTYDALKGKVRDVYADELYFNDTLKTLTTGEELEAHLLATGKMLTSGSVKYFSEMRDENGDYFVNWEMEYNGPKMNGGKPIVTIGMSQLRFNEEGEVIFHQDFWDSTSGIFEHIPVLGGMVQLVKKRL